MTEHDFTIIFFIVAALAICIYVSVSNSIRRKKEAEKALKKSWGKPSKWNGTDEEFKEVSFYFNELSDETSIDDITWNDLGMDEVFKRINNTNSSIGREFLYRMLREPDADKENLEKIDRLAREFTDNEKERIEVQKVFRWIGRTRKLSAADYIEYLIDIEGSSNVPHYFAPISIIVSLLITLFVSPVIGIWFFVASIAYAIISYYKTKAKIENYFQCINIFVKMLKGAEKLVDLNIDFLEEYNELLKKYKKTFSNVLKNSWMIESGNIDGSLSEVILDYLRMLTHVDIIKFNAMVEYIGKKSPEVYALYDTLGFIESTIAIASFRESLEYWTRPEFKDDNEGNSFELVDVYHPLIDNPVVNSIKADRNVLLTGSNASGKSTFLKTVAINAILSQTINTSLSKKYVAPCYRIFSSMALRDDLANNDSYYIVEIKSLKRIVDASKRNEKPVLCFIDEVLRGTNTVERIAASSEILKHLNKSNVICFAATHDVELTNILKDCFDNYHFQEEVTDDDVRFNYRLFEGPATTRNAIKLLKVIGYDSDITEGAENRAMYFLQNGLWKS